jgi:hypothetical protein
MSVALPFSDVRMVKDGTTSTATAFPQRAMRIDQIVFSTRPELPRPRWNLTEDDRQTLAVIADHLIERGYEVTPIDGRHVVLDTVTDDCEVDHLMKMGGRVCARCGIPRSDVRVQHRAYEPWEVVRVADDRIFLARELGGYGFPPKDIFDDRLRMLRAMLSERPPAIEPNNPWIPLHGRVLSPPLMVERILIGNVNQAIGPSSALQLSPGAPRAEGTDPRNYLTGMLLHPGQRMQLVLSNPFSTPPYQVRATALCIEGG